MATLCSRICAYQRAMSIAERKGFFITWEVIRGEIGLYRIWRGFDCGRIVCLGSKTDEHDLLRFVLGVV
jgi:hypothetical protein